MEKSDRGLLIVDVQNDFCPGGALAVSEGDRVVAVLNRYISEFQKKGCPIFASRDWHPPETKHFKPFGGLWPVHCVQQTPGAEFHPDLKLPGDAVIISKGMDPKGESYSAFLGVTAEGKSFFQTVRESGIEELFVGGLATDYCVKFSVLDAIKHGIKVNLLTDAIRGVDLEPGDSQKAVLEMVQQGARVLAFKEFLEIFDRRLS